MCVLKPAVSKGDGGELSPCLFPKSTFQDTFTAGTAGLGHREGPTGLLICDHCFSAPR